MENGVPNFSDSELAKLECVEQLIELCTSATRKWVNQEISRDYLIDLTGLAGVCITNSKEQDLHGHLSNEWIRSQEAETLLKKLSEVRELLRYPRYAAAELTDNASIEDTPTNRKILVEQHIKTEPGIDIPSP